MRTLLTLCSFQHQYISVFYSVLLQSTALAYEVGGDNCSQYRALLTPVFPKYIPLPLTPRGWPAGARVFPSHNICSICLTPVSMARLSYFAVQRLSSKLHKTAIQLRE